MTSFGEATGRQVVSTSTADTVGTVEGFIVDPASRRVVALRVKKAGVLRWGDLTAFGADAVTVDSADRVGDAAEDVARLTGKAHDPLGKRVLTATGDEQGKVVDVSFAPETGELLALETSQGSIPGRRLLGIGSYAVVVEG